MDRRTFVKSAAVAMTAQSYSRILGANDRIRLAQIGCGDRSHGHVHMVQLAAAHTPVETVAVCDLWSKARDRRAAQVESAFGKRPETYKYYEEMLKRKDIDGVVLIGAVIKGDTQHDEVIMHATAQAAAQMAAQTGKPVGFGVTGPGMTREQAVDRIDNAPKAVESVVRLLQTLKQIESS